MVGNRNHMGTRGFARREAPDRSGGRDAMLLRPCLPLTRGREA